ncbi:MAG: Fe-S cluster assembly protein SufD [Chroococcidiopsidaceae cyanobacterium CP_BM_ER_R8_30]|nr:Fe-S cluster assembly protein SufD [Chroococcidiopsidaceae cyanobacterium CP_BM_ER_R8_30]
MPIPNPDEVSLKSALTDRDPYLTELLNQCQGLSIQLLLEPESISWIQELRDRAAAWVRQCILPTTKDEEWRFTDMSFLKQLTFRALPQRLELAASAVAPLTLSEAAHSRLVFVDGVYAPTLSSVASLPDELVISNLAGLPLAYRSRVRDYLATAQGAAEVFTALNTSGLIDVAVVWVPKHLIVETPIHLLFISTASGTPTISQPRCLVVAESGSSVTLIEDYLNQANIESPEEGEAEVGEAVYFTNAVTEICLEAGAQVNHTRIERESPAAFHIGKSAITQARNSRYTCNAITLGAKLSRHNLEVFQHGEQTETTLNGLVTINSQQTTDTHSVIALNYPHGTSTQLHKCIIADQAHAVFNGKILVPQSAQLTNAGQLNRNLLLSPRARVDTKPQLEITADNVKCTHGATISQLDKEEVFYLQSRGLDATAAHNLLINAFATEIINKLPVASLRQTLIAAVSHQHL